MKNTMKVPPWANQVWVATPPATVKHITLENAAAARHLTGLYQGVHAVAQTAYSYVRVPSNWDNPMFDHAKHLVHIAKRAPTRKNWFRWSEPCTVESLVLRRLESPRTITDRPMQSPDIPMQHTHDTLSSLSLPEDWCPTDLGTNLAQIASSHNAARKLLYRAFNVARSPRSGRMTHALLGPGSRALRSIYAPDFVTLDIKSCFPQFLSSMAPPGERDEYLELLDADIYDALRDHTMPRTAAKIAMMILLAGKVFPDNPFHAAFQQHFPGLTEAIRAHKGSLAMQFQRLEARIMVDGVTTFAAERGIPLIPLHDGCMLPPEYAATIQNEMESQFYIETGITPQITATL